MNRPAAAEASSPRPVRHSYHAAPVHDVLKAVGSEASGLTNEIAARRLVEHGPNELPRAIGRHPVFRFLAQFHNALISSLIAAAVAKTARPTGRACAGACSPFR